jgi:hypothetical protein
MSYPPEGCSFMVSCGSASETFADEFAFGAWFTQAEEAGVVDRADPELSVFCVTDDGLQAIDIMHPRLVRGRIEQAAH